MSKSKPIYLDYASTTPVDERVAEKMLEYMTFNNNFGNAAAFPKLLLNVIYSNIFSATLSSTGVVDA